MAPHLDGRCNASNPYPPSSRDAAQLEFLLLLGRNVSAALRASADNRHRYLSIDSLILGAALPRRARRLAIGGIAYVFGTVRDDDGYALVLEFSRKAAVRWLLGDFHGLLPDPAVPGWFDIDRQARRLAIRLCCQS